jgi:hypothetical protein
VLVETVYALRRRISRVYLVDAAVEAALLFGWLRRFRPVSRTPRRARTSRNRISNRREQAMTALEEKLVEYIDDAYAMEQNVLRMLDGMIGTTKDRQMKRSLERHKKQTEQQAERLEECLREHGASPSKLRREAG